MRTITQDDMDLLRKKKAYFKITEDFKKKWREHCRGNALEIFQGLKKLETQAGSGDQIAKATLSNSKLLLETATGKGLYPLVLQKDSLMLLFAEDWLFHAFIEACPNNCTDYIDSHKRTRDLFKIEQFGLVNLMAV